MITLLKRAFHFAIAWISAVFYRFPSRKIYVLGVTGTKGKSTVLELINAILESAGKKTALLSSVRVKVGEDSEKNWTSMTMPGRGFIQRFLRRAVNNSCDYALIEVTSQGVPQYRHRFVDFDAALVTNLHPEHIEAHGSFERYRAAKVRFFYDVAHRSTKPEKLFFINEKLDGREYFERAANGSGKVLFFHRDDFIYNDLSSRYRLDSRDAKKMISGWLQSDFNLENVAAAVAFARAQGISPDIIFNTLEHFQGVQGRMEYVIRQPFAVVVDYAHTPDSLEAVYKTLSNDGAHKLIAVLGAAGGGRDQWKRPKMGAIAARYCKYIYLANEDPYDEPPLEIIEQIERGIWEERGRSNPETDYELVLDRKEAIRRALLHAKRGDVVILTGKGSEPWLHVARGKKISWNERGVVEELLAIDGNARGGVRSK
ncbi:MAG: UDP-N-acetylmuramyl-tripeptide synthetase [Candidatus Harrisonbacteria bacterium]|nr:UDP-N-acetylmuramyl-tripeptide synthetase [Candidatus Harrisonbacteria bacterium]